MTSHLIIMDTAKYKQYNLYRERKHSNDVKQDVYFQNQRQLLSQYVISIFHLENHYIWNKDIHQFLEDEKDSIRRIRELIPTFIECTEVNQIQRCSLINDDYIPKNYLDVNSPLLWFTLLSSCGSDQYLFIYDQRDRITLVMHKYVYKLQNVNGYLYYLEFTPPSEISGITEKEFDQLEKITDGKMVENEMCCLCLEDFNPNELVLGVGKNRMKVVRLPCKHMYHTKCIRTWITSRTSKCPYCTQCCKR